MSVASTDLLQTALNDSVERNHALPAECYTSDFFLQLELAKWFRVGWVCLGRADEVPTVGDFFTTSLVDEPVIVVRSDIDRIEVLANVCRHRGMPVAEGRGNTRKFRCRYHAWTYNLDGSLRNAPFMMKAVPADQRAGDVPPDQPLARCRLPAIRCHCWGGFIFASLSTDPGSTEPVPTEPVPTDSCSRDPSSTESVSTGSVDTAPEQTVTDRRHIHDTIHSTPDLAIPDASESLADRLFTDQTVNDGLNDDINASGASFDPGQLQNDIGAYHMENMSLIECFEETWDCNWKSLIENFMDAYHLSVVHPQTLRPLTPTNLCQKLSSGKNHTSYIANYTEAAPARQNHHPDLSAEQCRQSRLFCLYPSLVASVSADTLAFFTLQPMGLERVSVKWGLASFESDLSDSEKQARIEKWRAINDEDHAILQRLQSGLRSSYYQGGALAPAQFEGCINDFHRALITALLQ